MSTPRIPHIDPRQYNAEQQAQAQAFAHVRNRPVFGPFEPLMHSPKLMSATRAMGDYLRYHASIGRPLAELVILITAREWSQGFEWAHHVPEAQRLGVDPHIIDAIRQYQRPSPMSEAQAACYDFSIELHRDKQVSDDTFQRAQASLGTQGVMDLAALNGYYSLLAMVMNTAQTPVPEGSPTL
jgi:4-carboxymuconolactone decarboxylase